MDLVWCGDECCSLMVLQYSLMQANLRFIAPSLLHEPRSSLQAHHHSDPRMLPTQGKHCQRLASSSSSLSPEIAGKKRQRDPVMEPRT